MSLNLTRKTPEEGQLTSSDVHPEFLLLIVNTSILLSST